jgi:hypothetical protein
MNNIKYVKEQPYIKIREIIILLAVIVLTVILVIFYFTGNKGNNVEIYYQNNLLYSYPLYEDRVINVEDKLTVIIENKMVYVKQSTCPDQLCVHNNPISTSGNRIICLPNSVMILITGNSEIDGLV